MRKKLFGTGWVKPKRKPKKSKSRMTKRELLEKAKKTYQGLQKLSSQIGEFDPNEARVINLKQYKKR